MAEPATISLVITTVFSSAVGGLGIWRGMRADRNAAAAQQRADTAAARAAAGQEKAAEIVALKDIVAILQRDGETARQDSAQLRTELNTERQERAAAEDRLRSQIAEIRAARVECEAANRVLTVENQRLTRENDLLRGGSSNGR